METTRTMLLKNVFVVVQNIHTGYCTVRQSLGKYTCILAQGCYEFIADPMSAKPGEHGENLNIKNVCELRAVGGPMSNVGVQKKYMLRYMSRPSCWTVAHIFTHRNTRGLDLYIRAGMCIGIFCVYSTVETTHVMYIYNTLIYERIYPL